MTMSFLHNRPLMINRLQEFGIWPSKAGVRWFHFWNPHSGLLGGVINGALMFVVILAVLTLASCASLNRGYQPPGGGIYKALM